MINQKKLKEHLNYNTETGVFTRLVSSSASVKVGDVAGSLSGGYIRIVVNGKRHLAHRLAWLYIYGYFPENDIDHKNGIKEDNRLSNLREASRSCNNQNQRVSSRNTSGYPGVYWHKTVKKWTASIRINSKNYHLGCHETPLDAGLARLTEEVWNINWQCNHRGELVKKIKASFHKFNEKSIN